MCLVTAIGLDRLLGQLEVGTVHERVVERAHRQLSVFRTDHYRNLDFRGGDHLDIDSLTGEHFEHPRGDAGVGSHTYAHNRYFRNLVLVAHAGRSDLCTDAPDQLEGAYQVVAVDREGHVGATISTGVLNDHVHHDVGRGDRTKNPGREARPIFDASDGDFALILIERHSGNEQIFHRWV